MSIFFAICHSRENRQDSGKDSQHYANNSFRVFWSEIQRVDSLRVELSNILGCIDVVESVWSATLTFRQNTKILVLLFPLLVMDETSGWYLTRVKWGLLTLLSLIYQFSMVGREVLTQKRVKKRRTLQIVFKWLFLQQEMLGLFREIGIFWRFMILQTTKMPNFPGVIL